MYKSAKAKSILRLSSTIFFLATISSCSNSLYPGYYTTGPVENIITSWIDYGQETSRDSLRSLEEYTHKGIISYRNGRIYGSTNVSTGKSQQLPYDKYKYTYNIWGRLKRIDYYREDTLSFQLIFRKIGPNKIRQIARSASDESKDLETILITNKDGVVIERNYLDEHTKFQDRILLDSLNHPLEKSTYQEDSTGWIKVRSSKTISKKVDSLGNWIELYTITDHKWSKSSSLVTRKITYAN